MRVEAAHGGVADIIGAIVSVSTQDGIVSDTYALLAEVDARTRAPIITGKDVIGVDASTLRQALVVSAWIQIIA